MKTGVMFGGMSSQLGIDDLVTRAKDLEARGFDTLWVPNVFGIEAVTAASIIGRETERIEIATAVVPT